MSVQAYQSERYAPGDPPYEIRIEHADGWETVTGAASWDTKSNGTLVVNFSDIGGSVEYDGGEVLEVIE